MANVNKKKGKESNKQRALREFLSENFRFRFDEIRNLIEVAPNRGKFEQLHVAKLWTYINEEHAPTSKDYMLNTIEAPHISPPYNAIKSYLRKAKPLSGAFDKLSKYILFAGNTEQQREQERQRFVRCFRKWYVGCLKTFFNPDYVHKQALIFCGPQGIGKTPFCKGVLPKALRQFVKSIRCLNFSNKDNIIPLARYLVMVLDEIHDFFKTKHNRDNYKSFATESAVTERLLYDKYDTHRPRIASFLGTSNESNFLNDPTGTQRFTVFNVKAFMNEELNPKDAIEDFNFGGLIGEAYRLLREGFNPRYTLEEREENEANNEQFKYNSEEYDAVARFVSPSQKDDENAEFMTTSDIRRHLNISQDLTFSSDRSLGKALVRLGFKRVPKKVNGISLRGYYIRRVPQQGYAEYEDLANSQDINKESKP